MNKARILLIITLFHILPVFLYAQDNIFRDVNYHYSFNIPSGWYRIPKEVIDRAAREAERLTGTRTVGYVAGLQYGNSDVIKEPYILIQKHDVRISWAEFRDTVSLNNITNSDLKDYSEYILNFNTSSSFIDYERKMFILNVEADVAQVGKKRGIAVMVLGRNNIIQLNINVLTSNYDRYSADIYRIINTFKYDNGYDYR
jgi:hypothetical protein